MGYGCLDKDQIILYVQVNVSPRKVSNEMHKTVGNGGRTTAGSKGFTHMAMQFGQFLAHDIALTPEGGCSHFLKDVPILFKIMEKIFKEIDVFSLRAGVLRS